GRAWSGRLQREAHDVDHAHPGSGFLLELSPARGGEPVVLRAALVLGLAFTRGEEAALLEAVQGGEQRARADPVGAFRDLLDPARDAEPVERLQAQRLEDQEVQRSRE